MARNRLPLRRARDELRRARPSLGNPDAAILLGRIAAGDRVLERPTALVPEGAALAFLLEVPL